MEEKKSRMSRWLHRMLPTREKLEKSRLMRPFVVRQELWRFTRRSVPRGVAVGLLMGFLMVWPPMQVVGAVILCVPFRANIPLSAAMTLLSNPVTIPPLYVGSVYLGNWLGFDVDLSMVRELYHSDASFGEWLAWLFSDVAPALLTGLLVISVIAAAIGYMIASVVWRWMVARKRRARLGQGADMRVAQ